MVTPVRNLLHKAQADLKRDRDHIAGQIAMLRKVVRGERAPLSKRPSRQPMPHAARREVSRRMKSYWTKWRAARGKARSQRAT